MVVLHLVENHVGHEDLLSVSLVDVFGMALIISGTLQQACLCLCFGTGNCCSLVIIAIALIGWLGHHLGDGLYENADHV